jgi:hypothetical protein
MRPQKVIQFKSLDGAGEVGCISIFVKLLLSLVIIWKGQNRTVLGW